jgi:micrococcal nuclease
MPTRRALILLAAFAVAAVGIWRPVPGGAGGGDGATTADGTVTRVVDGDTIHVAVDGADETVRYIGIDTPESVKPGTPVQCFAEAASAANRRLVDGRRVVLTFDAERRDRYGRLLAYVRRAGDGLFVNEELVRDGYARTLTIPPNVRYASRFGVLAAQARDDGRGLWRSC